MEFLSEENEGKSESTWEERQEGLGGVIETENRHQLIPRRAPWWWKGAFETSFLHPEQAPGGSAVKNPPAMHETVGSIPGTRRSPGGGHGNPLQYSCLQNLMDRGAWWAIVHRVTNAYSEESSPLYLKANM